MTRQDIPLLTGGSVPKLDVLFHIARSNEAPVFAQSKGTDAATTLQALHFTSSLQVPQPDCAVYGSRGHGPAVATKRYRFDCFCVAGECAQFPAGRYLPQPDCVIDAAGDKPLSVRTKGHCFDTHRMSCLEYQLCLRR